MQVWKNDISKKGRAHAKVEGRAFDPVLFFAERTGTWQNYDLLTILLSKSRASTLVRVKSGYK
ncbi:MAG: hypothetical protein KBT07_00050 [Clostridiales bacterium]|nr:hypothetical protein [Candidatus Scatonaster coprocaballi]